MTYSLEQCTQFPEFIDYYSQMMGITVKGIIIFFLVIKLVPYIINLLKEKYVEYRTSKR